MTAQARFDLRMSPGDKDRIARAARLRKVSMASFVRQAALREAEATMVAARKAGAVAHRLRGRATTSLSTEEIMQLTRGA